jgi:C1A family cysteine protease
MTRSILIAFIVLGLCSFTAQAAKQLQDTTLFYNIFKDWASQFNKNYGIEEMAVRFYNWKSNLDYVNEHNSKGLSSTLGMNHLADLSTEEFSALHLGLNINLDARKTQKKNTTEAESTENATKKANTTATPLPKSVDWRSAGAVAQVKDQGQCGGCWSFSASGALEGLHAIKNKKLTSFSEQQMIDCSADYGNQGCDGGLMTNAFNYTMSHGIQPEDSYPYAAEAGTCSHDPKKVAFKNTGFAEVAANNSDALKAIVAQQPVSVGIEATSMAVQLFQSGVINAGCGTELDHGVLVVGYDDTKAGHGYWIVKNSWGAKWGLNGFFNIAMGSQNGGAGACGINMMPSYPTL